MFNDLDTDQIMDFLSPLVEDEIITGKAWINGILFVDSYAQAVLAPTPETPEYDQLHYGLKMTDLGCILIEQVNDRIDNWLQNGTDFQKEIAAATSRFYAVLLPRNYTDLQKYHQYKAANSLFFYFGGIKFGLFYQHIENYFNGTGETRYWLTTAEKRSGEWTRHSYTRGDIIPNTTAIGGGNLPTLDDDWEEQFGSLVPNAILDRMDRRVARLVKWEKAITEGKIVARPILSVVG